MSFSKTVSVVAALASIFSVGVASWKMSEEIKKEQTNPLEEKIQQLEKQLEEATTQKPVQQVAPPPQITAPQPVILPPVTPPLPVPENDTP
jgi:hypothetical protein